MARKKKVAKKKVAKKKGTTSPISRGRGAAGQLEELFIGLQSLFDDLSLETVTEFHKAWPAIQDYLRGKTQDPQEGAEAEDHEATPETRVPPFFGRMLIHKINEFFEEALGSLSLTSDFLGRLLPCPFCGREHNGLNVDSEGIGVVYKPEVNETQAVHTKLTVTCTSCHTSKCFFSCTNEDVIAQWNSRQPQ